MFTLSISFTDPAAGARLLQFLGTHESAAKDFGIVGHTFPVTRVEAETDEAPAPPQTTTEAETPAPPTPAPTLTVENGGKSRSRRKKEEPAQAPSPRVPSEEELEQAARAYIRAHGMAAMVERLKEQGVARISELNQTQLAALYAQITA